MPSTPRSVRVASGRSPTFTEQTRRRQLIDVTIDLIGAHGAAGCSLQRIADAAGITKAAVIYHFASKNAVISAAYDSVLADLVGVIETAVGSAVSPAAAVENYVATMIGHLARHPSHARVLAEAIAVDASHGDAPASTTRSAALAGLIEAAKASGEYGRDVDAVAVAVIVGGAIDGLIARRIDDPDFDLAAATEVLQAALTSMAGG